MVEVDFWLRLLTYICANQLLKLRHVNKSVFPGPTAGLTNLVTRSIINMVIGNYDNICMLGGDMLAMQN